MRVPVVELLSKYDTSKKLFGRYIPGLNEKYSEEDAWELIRKDEVVKVLEKYRKKKYIILKDEIIFFEHLPEMDDWKKEKLRRGTKIRLWGPTQDQYFNFYEDPTYPAIRDDEGNVIDVLPVMGPGYHRMKRKFPQDMEWLTDPYVISLPDKPYKPAGVTPIFDLVHALEPELFVVLERYFYQITGVPLYECIYAGS